MLTESAPEASGLHVIAEIQAFITQFDGAFLFLLYNYLFRPLSHPSSVQTQAYCLHKNAGPEEPLPILLFGSKLNPIIFPIGL